MKKRDIIEELSKSIISFDEAYDLLEKYQSDWNEDLPHWTIRCGMSKLEASAHFQGAGLDDLAKWRYKGWPDICPICTQKIDMEREKWMVKDICEEDEREEIHIFHLGCLPNVPDNNDEKDEEEHNNLLEHTDGTKCFAGTKRVPKDFSPCCNVFANHTLTCTYDIRYEWWKNRMQWVISIPNSQAGIEIFYCPHCGKKLHTDWQKSESDDDLLFSEPPSIVLGKILEI